MSTKRVRDPNGFLMVAGCPISSFGIFQYSAAQLGLPGDPNRIVNVFRPESAVSDPEALKSFQNIPLINDHEMLSGFSDDDGATAPEDYGIDGVLTSNVYYEAPWMRGDLKIFTRKLQEYLAAGKKDLSLGYSCEFQVKPGVFEGVAYEVIQYNMRGNHIALVGEGRVPGAKVLDGLIFDSLSFSVQPSNEESKMKRSKKVMDNAVAQLKQLLPALEQFLNEEAAEPAHQDPAAGAVADPADPAAAGNPAAADPAVADDPAAAIEGGASEPVADPAADPAATEPTSVAESDLPALIGQFEALLGKLKASMAGETEGAPADADPATDPAAAADPAAADPAAAEPATDPADPAVDSSADPEGAPLAADNVDPGTTGLDPEVKPGAKAADAAISGFYADLAAKTRLYDRLSKVAGAFDCASMDAGAVARYGVKTLKLRCAAGQEAFALDAYLGGIEAAAKATKTQIQQTATKVADAANADELTAYLKGK